MSNARHDRSSLVAASLLFLLAVLLPQNLISQATTGVILGTVTDATGAVVPGTAVQITNEGTGKTQNTTTDAQGRYNAPDLLVGTYDVLFLEPHKTRRVLRHNLVDVGHREHDAERPRASQGAGAVASLAKARREYCVI